MLHIGKVENVLIVNAQQLSVPIENTVLDGGPPVVAAHDAGHFQALLLHQLDEPLSRIVVADNGAYQRLGTQCFQVERHVGGTPQPLKTAALADDRHRRLRRHPFDHAF